jgi:hypothetical protein
MKGKSALAVLALAALAAPAMATYSSIQHNGFDGIDDFSFDGTTLLIDLGNVVPANLITLNDPGPLLGGAVTNGRFQLRATLVSVLNATTARFGNQPGDFLSLTFDYNGVPKQISGPLFYMDFTLNVQSPAFSTIDGLGDFTPAVINLPGSNDWSPLGPHGRSSVDSLTLSFNANLAGFDWTGQPGGYQETQYQLTPGESGIPEPASLVLLAAGALTALRRRR